MLGAIFGDIVGSRFEFTGFKSKEFELFNAHCTFTDDTLMTLAIANSMVILKDDLFNLEALKDKIIYNMVDIYNKYPDTNWGERFHEWLVGFKTPLNSFGNGAAMRVSPVGWVAKSIEEVKILSKAVTELSHNHLEALKGAEAIAMAIYLARTGVSKEEIRNYIGDNYYPEVLNSDFASLVRNYGHVDKSSEDGFYYRYVTCQGSVPHAIRAFLASNSFEDAIRNAISLGGDSDTLACMAGSVAEAFYGITPSFEFEVIKRLPDDLLNIYFAFETIKIKK